MPVTINGTTGIAGPDGSASTPAVQGTDSNTGLFYPAADTVALSTGGSERMRIDSSGNVGIGVTPSSWSGISGKVFEFGYSGGNAALFQNGVNDTHFTSNAYYNGSAWTYNKTGTATRFYQGSGTFQMHGASSGTAGNAITFTQIFGLSKGNTLFLEGATSQSGTGITFPSTQSASSDANTLDDYEEGTWTPSLGGTATYSDQTGTYTKIGRQVTVRYRIAVSSIGTGSTTTLTGLPFTASGNGTGALYWDTSLVAMVYCTGFATSTSIVFYRASSGDFSLSTGSGIFKNGTTVDGITTYFV